MEKKIVNLQKKTREQVFSNHKKKLIFFNFLPENNILCLFYNSNIRILWFFPF